MSPELKIFFGLAIYIAAIFLTASMHRRRTQGGVWIFLFLAVQLMSFIIVGSRLIELEAYDLAILFTFFSFACSHYLATYGGRYRLVKMKNTQPKSDDVQASA